MSSGSKIGTQVCYPFPSKSPGKRIPSRFPNGVPMERNTRLQGIFYLSLNISVYLSTESPVRESPPCSLTGTPWTAILCHQSHWSTFHSFIHLFMYVCRSPQKGALLHTYGEKHKVTVHGAPHRRKAYIQWDLAWFPKGIVMTLLSLPQCHAAFSTIPSTLAWVDQGHVSQHVSW